MPPVSRFWPILSLALIVVSLVYPYLLGQGSEFLSPAGLRDLRFQHCLRALSLLALWLTAPRGPGLHRLMFLIAGLGLLFSKVIFAAEGISRLLWGLTALAAVWAVHYNQAASRPPLAKAIPGVSPPSGNSFPVGQTFPAPLNGNAWPPTPPNLGVRPPDMVGGQFVSQWSEAAAKGLFSRTDDPAGPFERIMSLIIKTNVVALLLYCAALAVYCYFGQYLATAETADEFEGIFSLIALPFVVAPSILLPGLFYWLLTKAGGGRPVFLAIAGTAAAASLLFVLATAADPLLNGPLGYDRFEALAGFQLVGARWAGAAALVAALALLITRRMEGDNDLEFPSTGLPPSALTAGVAVLALAASAGTIWIGGQAYGRHFRTEPYRGTLTAERLGPLEINLPQGFKMPRALTAFDLESGQAVLSEVALEPELGSTDMAQILESFRPDPDDENDRSVVIEIEGQKQPTFLTVRYFPPPTHFYALDFDPEDLGIKMEDRMELTLWRQQPGGHISLEMQRNYDAQALGPEAARALENAALDEFRAWALDVFVPAYHWTGREARPEGRWLTGQGYIEGDIRQGFTANIHGEKYGFWGQIAWNMSIEDHTVLYRPPAQPRSLIGRAADHYRGRAGLTRSLAVSGRPGREVLASGREGCMFYYGCRSDSLTWVSADPKTPLRLSMNSGGFMTATIIGGQKQTAAELGRWRALLQGLSIIEIKD